MNRASDKKSRPSMRAQYAHRLHRSLVKSDIDDTKPPSADLLYALSKIDKDFQILAQACVHEFYTSHPMAGICSSGFIFSLLAYLDNAAGGSAKPVFWCSSFYQQQENGALSGRGLHNLGRSPERMVLAQAQKDMDVLWALEEALRSNALSAVVGEVTKADLTRTRRLTLAAREGETPLFLLRSKTGLGPSAARSRWRITPAPSGFKRFLPSVPGPARWRIDMEKGWTDRPHHWVVEWDNETCSFHMVTPMAHYAPETRADTKRKTA